MGQSSSSESGGTACGGAGAAPEVTTHEVTRDSILMAVDSRRAASKKTNARAIVHELKGATANFGTAVDSELLRKVTQQCEMLFRDGELVKFRLGKGHIQYRRPGDETDAADSEPDSDDGPGKRRTPQEKRRKVGSESAGDGESQSREAGKPDYVSRT